MTDAALFFEPDIATKLECEDLEAVTSEDIALEVSLKLYDSFFFILTYSYKCEKFLNNVLQVMKEIEKLTRVKKMMEEASRPF